jgi:hypothetical protein
MKNVFKVLGIIAIVAVIGFSMAACDNGAGGAPDPCAGGHNFGAWGSSTANCTTAGKETRVCSHNASHTEERGADALGHDWVPEGTQITVANCTTEGLGQADCSRCHLRENNHVFPIDPNNHSWGDYVQITAPTCTTPGMEKRTCSRDISHTEEPAIAALGHNLVDGICSVCLLDTNEPNPGQVHLGNTLTLSGQVYTIEGIFENYSYQELDGNSTVISAGGTGSITNGSLSFSIGTPGSLELASSSFWPQGSNFSVNPPAAQGAGLDMKSGTPYKGEINRMSYGSFSGTQESGTFTFYYVIYTFVDRDVTISSEYLYENGEPYGREDFIFNAFTLNLEKGWNAVHFKCVHSWAPGTPDTKTYTVTLANPDYKWIFGELDD